MIEKSDFISKSTTTLQEILDWLDGLPVILLKELRNETSAMFIVDMINGFAREGALSSPRVEGLIPGIAVLSRRCGEAGIVRVAFADSHTAASPEFEAYPPHCMADTPESELVDELKEAGGYRLIPKNSTNGFLEPEFQEWLAQNRQIHTFILTGDCTDICVQQFATTLKTWFNRQNLKSRVIVPANAVDTYDLGLHNGDLMHVVALYNMSLNGVEIVKNVI